MKVNDLTVEELEIVEQKSGQSISTLEDPTAPKMKILRALAWVIKKHETPNFKYEDAGKLKLEEIMEIIGLDEEDDPLE